MQLRPATPDDDPALRALFAACFPASPKADAAILRWQYWDNPFAPVRSWVAVDGTGDDGEIVAHYAGLPVPAVLDGDRATVVLGVDAATAPQARQRGLFRQVARAVHDDAAQAGLAATLVFPSNPFSLRALQQAGAVEVGRVGVFVLPRSPLVARGEAAEEVAGPPVDLDGLWSEVSSAVTFGLARDGAWWRWRYACRPGSDYRYFEVRAGGSLRGAAVTTVRRVGGRRFVHLLELLTLEASTARALVRAAVRGAAVRGAVGGRGAVGVATIALPGSPVAALARQAGLVRVPRRLEPRPLHFAVVDNAGTRPGLSSAAWSVTWGDVDHL